MWHNCVFIFLYLYRIEGKQIWDYWRFKYCVFSHIFSNKNDDIQIKTDFLPKEIKKILKVYRDHHDPFLLLVTSSGGRNGDRSKGRGG